MNTIALANLLYMLLPLAMVGYLYYRWLGDMQEIAYASLRMVSQLLLIGYLLVFIFQNDATMTGVLIVFFMIAVSSLIALRHFKERSRAHYLLLLGAIGIGGTFNLLIVLILVLELEPLYQPRIVIPLAGMIYANAMNAVSLAAERYESERAHAQQTARVKAFRSALIPQVNAFMAVGLVSLPGMMTGQILAGVDPLIAVRYQMMVMAMVLGSAGISVGIYLAQIERLRQR
ncbi:MAG: ABC transporter permease [Campylobacterales bacterium]|nr:ABC transporter permease [Campylobacterales bacterium]